MIVFQMRQYRQLKFCMVPDEYLYGSAFKKMEIISSLNDCNWACLIFLLLSHFRLHSSVSLCLCAALGPGMTSGQRKVNHCLSEGGFKSCVCSLTDTATHAGAFLAGTYNNKDIFKACSNSD